MADLLDLFDAWALEGSRSSREESDGLSPGPDLVRGRPLFESGVPEGVLEVLVRLSQDPSPPVIDRRVPLSKVKEALEDPEAGRVRGKVIVTIDG